MSAHNARLHNTVLQHRNRLLNAFEPAIQARLEAHLKPVVFKLGDMICDAGEVLDHVYFPESGALALLTVLENGSAIETASIGSDGAFGLSAAISSSVSSSRCIVQVEGPMVRCPVEPLRAAFDANEQLRGLIVGFLEGLLSQAQQTAACYALHGTEQRLARSILTMHDYADGNILTCTHEFLSQILGANRKSITLAAQSLQTAKLISYRRGLMEVQNRAGLEQAACECFGIIRSRRAAFHNHAPAATIRRASERSWHPAYAASFSSTPFWAEDERSRRERSGSATIMTERHRSG